MIEQEYKPDSNDEEYEEYEPQKGFKNYFKSPFKNNKHLMNQIKKKCNWKKEKRRKKHVIENVRRKKKEFEEKYPESQPSTTKAGKIRLRFTKEK